MDCRGLLAAVVVLRLQTTLFHSISHFTKYSDRKGAHPPLLLSVERLIERLPRIGDPLKVAAPWAKAVTARRMMREVDRSHCESEQCTGRAR